MNALASAASSTSAWPIDSDEAWHRGVGGDGRSSTGGSLSMGSQVGRGGDCSRAGASPVVGA